MLQESEQPIDPWRLPFGKGGEWCGPDHSSLEGARALAKRLNDYWAAQGQPREHEIYLVRGYGATFGVRLRRPIPINRPEVVKRAPPPKIEVGERPRDKWKAICVATLQEKHPGIPFYAVAGGSRRRLGGRVLEAIWAARRDCVRALKAADPKLSTTQLGAFFKVHHTTIMYALTDECRARRQAKDKKLRAKVAA